MLQKKFKEKYNDGCIKIFKLLELLYEDKAEYDDVMAIFSGDEEDAEKQHVTLNKFLNTLKVFGTKVTKTNNRFEMQNIPFALQFDIDDLKSINLLNKVIELLPAGKNKDGLAEFLKNIESRFDDKTKLKFKEISSNDNKDYTFYYSNLKEQIEECEKYCQSDYKLTVKYLDKNKEVSTYCNAKQLIFDNKSAYLRIYKINENVFHDILITNIISIKQMPTKKNENEQTQHVAFKLKRDLAKSYVLKEGEKIGEFCADGSMIVINRDEPIDTLLKRLMKYDYECTILRPHALRDKMKEMINDTLKNYE